MTATPWPSAPAVPFEPPASLEVANPADAAVLAACAVAALGADLARRAGRPGLAAAVVPVAVCAALVASRRFPNPQARVLLAMAPLVTAFLALRTNEATALVDVVAAAVLVGLAASLARGGSLLDLTFPGLAGRLALTSTHGLLAPAFVLRPLGSGLARRPGGWALARGLAIGLPVVAALVALLASADAVFASLLHLPDVTDLTGHALLLGLGAGAAAAVLRHASARTADLPLGSAPTLGRVEARVVLGGLAAVFATFAAAQVAVAAGGADRILDDEGLTYAEYARTGFFQLLAAAVLTAVVLLCVRACGSPRDVVAKALMLAVVALTEVIVGLALHRLALYEQAYGLTLLRLGATAAAVWIGLAFLLFGVAAAGVGAGRSWLPVTVGATALVGLLAWNAVNPAALVARRDLVRAAVDPAYLASLGDDALPTVVARLDRLDPAVRAEVVDAICARPPEPRRPVLGWNRSASQAGQAHRTLGC